MLLLVACGSPDDAAQQAPGGDVTSPISTSTEPSSGMRPGVFPSTRVEPPTDAGRPDGPPATPDDTLTPAELTALLRIDATGDPAADRCTPADLRLSLRGFDAAAGTIYAQVLATNVSGHKCTLLGWPGMGFRGEWGTAFPVVAERDPSPSDRVGAVPHDPAEPIVLAPGDDATADIEWTGARAGATEEKVSLIAVQLVRGGPAAALFVSPDDHVDIGESTTVRVRQWAPSATGNSQTSE